MPGTDTAGSVRVPAACCGVLGFRPSHGAVTVVGVIPMAQSFDTVGKDPVSFQIYSGSCRGLNASLGICTCVLLFFPVSCGFLFSLLVLCIPSLLVYAKFEFGVYFTGPELLSITSSRWATVSCRLFCKRCNNFAGSRPYFASAPLHEREATTTVPHR